MAQPVRPPALPDHIARLELPTPYPVGPVNAYVVFGRRLTLVDVGPNTDEGEAALLDGLRALGLAPGDIQQIVITHPHVDHHGGLDRFRRHSPRARVAAHVAGARFFGAQPQTRLGFYARWLAEAGMPETLVQPALEGLRRLGELEPTSPVDWWLQDGDLVPMGDGVWRVLHTPGHSGAQVCLYHEPTGVMFTADHVLPDVSSNAIIEPPPAPGAGRPRTLVQYLDALRRVAALPVRLALPGHGQPFVDVQSLVSGRLQMHGERMRRLLELLGGAPATVFGLARAMFPNAAGQQLVLALSEIQGHLDVLEGLEQVMCAPAGEGPQPEALLYRPVRAARVGR